MAKGCRITIIHLSHVFKNLCAKIKDPMTMKDLKQDVDITLKVLLEWELPFSFSNVMTHLLVHLMKKL
jgi:hypothetical protein